MAPFVSADPPQVLQTGKEGTIEWIPEHVEGSNNIGYSNPSDEFSLVKGLGQGSMGTVFLAVHRSTKKPYAMKVMSKDVLRRRDAFKMASMERDILSTLDHPFLPSLLTHFESEKHTFLAMKYCSGGDINVLRHRQPNKTFSESATRFYAAEVVLALEYLHEQGIVYRDLKPENILVQDNGHIMLTDFDLSVRLSSKGQSGRTSPEDHSRPHKVSRSTFGFIRRERKFQNTVGNEPSKRSNYGHEKVGVPCAQSHSFVGTKEYIAPEIIWCTGHGFPVDWWSLGIFLYEMVHGSTPFSGATRKETFFNILCRDPRFPGPWSSLQDLIQKLLVKEPSKRLGSLGGADEVKRHEFFRGLRWDALEFVSRPPFVPPLMSPDEIISNRQPLYETMLVGSDRSDESTHTITSAECLAIEDYPNDLFGSGSAFNHF